MVPEIGQRSVPRPAIFVHASVDHQSHCAPHLVGLAAELLIGGLVDPHLLAKPFGVESPALAIAGEIELLAEVEVVVPPELRQELVLGDVVLDLLRVGEEDEPALFMAGVEDLGN